MGLEAALLLQEFSTSGRRSRGELWLWLIPLLFRQAHGPGLASPTQAAPQVYIEVVPWFQLRRELMFPVLPWDSILVPADPTFIGEVSTM
jgi:hypothetical protein